VIRPRRRQQSVPLLFVDKDYPLSLVSCMADDSYLQVSEVAHAISGLVAPRDAGGDALAFAARRIRNWSTLRILVPVGGPHTGTGIVRRYDRRSVYAAACLCVLSDAGLPTGGLLQVSAFVRDLTSERPLLSGAMHDLWRRAVRGEEAVFLLVSPVEGALPGRSEPHPDANLITMASGANVAEELNRSRSGAFANLTRTFAGLRL
jgi:hypothetical protein